MIPPALQSTAAGVAMIAELPALGAPAVAGVGEPATALLSGAAVCAAFALLALLLRAVDVAGALAGWLLAVAVWAGFGWRGFLLLAAFVALGSAATRLGYGVKARRGVAQGHGGRRGVANALANGAVAAVCALAAAFLPAFGLLRLAFAGALATALADTLGSEIGQLRSGRTWLVTSWRRVPPGTEGAVSAAGTAAGAAGAGALALLGSVVGLYTAPAAGLVALAGIAGSAVDSLVGATLESRGLTNNEGTNLLATLAGAAVALGLGTAGRLLAGPAVSL